MRHTIHQSFAAFGALAASIAVLALLHTSTAFAQLSSSELYSQYQNRIGVADTLTQKLMGQQAAIRAGYDAQAQEEPVDPSSYVLGPGDGVYLDVFAVHSLDQDLTVTPEGRLIIPRIGRVDVAGLTVTQAQTKVNALLARDYKTPDASLTLRKLRAVKVSILGEVLQPGVHTATSLQRVSELIDRSGGFNKSSSLRNIEVRTASGQIRAHADLYRYYSLGDLSANPVVQSGDVIYVPQARQFVTLNGSVGAPGKMEYAAGDSLSGILALAKGALPASVLDSIEIARFSSASPGAAGRIYVSLLRGENPAVQDGDIISIRSQSQYHVPKLVAIGGEVPYPGRFAIEPGVTRIKDIIYRAGGILPTGSLDEAGLIRRVGVGSWENDPELARLSSISGMRKEGLTEEEYTYYVARIRQLNRSVMVVDFKALMLNNDQSQNMLLREEDSIYIPRARGYVTVSGSINNQGNVGYIEGANFEEYIQKAGGYASNADKSAVVIVSGKTGSYIDPRSARDYAIVPGDMIIVPKEESTFWKNMNTATAITAQVLTIVAGIFLLVKK